MKILLGDNQFFGINHHDLKKGDSVKKKFASKEDIISFINSSINLGLDGFMINSNLTGYNVVNDIAIDTEIHYSIPYPHKYASMVNESGMLSLLKFFISNSSAKNIFKCIPKYMFTGNLKYLLSLATDLEIPSSLKKNNVIYLQNILTDLIIGLDRIDILEEFFKEINKKGYRVGLITLNPTRLNKIIKKSHILNNKDLIVCFNINFGGFNVFPSKSQVVSFIKEEKKFKLMGMSIFSSGGADINESASYIKSLDLDYIVFGSSKLENIENNLKLFRNNFF